MDTVYRQLLACLAAFAQGGRAQILKGMDDWDALHTLAGHHKLEAVVYSSLSREAGFCGGDAGMISAWRQRAYALAMNQSHKNASLSALTAALDCPYALVKGAVCRSLYQNGDLRISADEDIYIRPEDYDRAAACLEKSGFILHGGSREDVSHWFCKVSGLHIELHTRLLEEDGEEALFTGFTPVQLTTQNGSLYTLEPGLHLAFLVCHARKHLISGGVGIRTLCDIALFYQKNRAAIDETALSTLLDKLSCKALFLHILAIGKEALGIHCGRADLPPMAQDLLEDVLEGGIYGQSSLTRHHSGTYTAQQAKGRKRLLRTLFPTREALQARYPVLKEHPGRLPLVWLQRLGSYAKEVTSRADSSPAGSLQLGKKRLEMLVKYDIVSKDERKIS